MELKGPVLALGAHFDDIELGCGGTLALLQRRGVPCHALTVCAGHPGDGRESENAQAQSILGTSVLPGLGLPIRYLTDHRQEVADALFQIRESLQPRIVLVHANSDHHQDHWVVANEVQRVFRHCTILGYEVPWSGNCTPLVWMPLEPSDVDSKWDALCCYRSQADKQWINERVVKGHLAMRGSQIGVEWAEAFQLLRGVLA